MPGRSGNLGQEVQVVIDMPGFQRLPPVLYRVMGHVEGDGVGVNLRVTLPAGVVLVNRHDQVPGRPTFIPPLPPDPRFGVLFNPSEGFLYRRSVSIEQPVILPKNRHD